ncbi:MAG: hypothetical protein ACK52M_11305 [bacterium]
MKNRSFHATAVAAAVACLLPGMAADLLAQPAAVALPKTGSCPSGYSTSGNYCVPGSGARFALPKVGSCPSGYSTSGDYCLASQGARHAMPKTGSCPSGYSTSGDYCLSSR